MGSPLTEKLNELRDICGLTAVSDTPGSAISTLLRFQAAQRPFCAYREKDGLAVTVRALNARHAAYVAALLHGGEWVARDHFITVVDQDGVRHYGAADFVDSRAAVVDGTIIVSPKEVILESI